MSFLTGQGITGAAPTASGAPGLNLTQYGPAIAQAMQQLGVSQGQQSAFANQLQGFLNNPTQGPNLANQQLIEGTQANNQAGAGAAASVQGLSPALAQRQILENTAQNNQQEVGQAAEARLQQQIADQAQISGIEAAQAGEASSELASGSGAQNNQNAGQIQNQGLNQAAQIAQLNAQTQLLGAGTGAAGTVGAAALKAAPAAATVAAAAHGGELGKLSAKEEFTRHYADAEPSHAWQLLNAYRAGKGSMDMRAEGGKIPGEAKVEGDSEENDTIPIMGSPGEVMVPRTMVKKIHSNPEAVVEFIRKAVSKDGSSSSRDLLMAHRSKMVEARA